MYNFEKFQKVFQKTIQMLLDRKYIIPKYLINLELNPYLIDVFFEKFDGTLFFKYALNLNYLSPKESLLINKKKQNIHYLMLFFSTEKFGVKELRLKITEINLKNINHVIFILENKFTLHGQKLLNKYTTLEEEIFYFDELLIDAIYHNLVPKHELLTTEESKQLLKTVGNKIPAIKKTDRICRHFNGHTGQIFRIYRQNELYYRIVV